jgi:hypothetical protein
MNIPMTPTDFMSIHDIVLLEIFTYLSYGDVLYAFGDLLREHGAFWRFCLSSQLSRCQYQVLSKGIWSYDLFICKEMFSDYISDLTPCQIFPTLTELRLNMKNLQVSSLQITPMLTMKSFDISTNKVFISSQKSK